MGTIRRADTVLRFDNERTFLVLPNVYEDECSLELPSGSRICGKIMCVADDEAVAVFEVAVGGVDGRSKKLMFDVTLTPSSGWDRAGFEPPHGGMAGIRVVSGCSVVSQVVETVMTVVAESVTPHGYIHTSLDLDRFAWEVEPRIIYPIVDSVECPDAGLRSKWDRERRNSNMWMMRFVSEAVSFDAEGTPMFPDWDTRDWDRRGAVEMDIIRKARVIVAVKPETDGTAVCYMSVMGVSMGSFTITRDVTVFEFARKAQDRCGLAWKGTTVTLRY